MNFYKHHIGDYDSHTIELTWTQDLVYRRLLSAYYLRERPLPDNFPILCRMVKAQEASQKAALRYVLERYFTQHAPLPKVPGTPDADTLATWHNERADIEIQQYQAQCLANRRTTQQRIVKRIVDKNATNRSPNQNQIPDISLGLDVPYTYDDPNLDEINSQLAEATNHSTESTEPTRKPNSTWWKTNEGIESKARELELWPAKSGENWPDLKNRCFEQINQNR